MVKQRRWRRWRRRWQRRWINKRQSERKIEAESDGGLSCSDSKCVHVYSISLLQDPFRIGIGCDWFNYINPVIFFFLIHSYFSFWFSLWVARKNDYLRIPTIYGIFKWCIIISTLFLFMSIPRIKWNMYQFTNLFQFTLTLPKKRTRLWHSHDSIFAQLFRLLNFSSAVNRILSIHRSMFVCENSSARKNHLY